MNLLSYWNADHPPQNEIIHAIAKGYFGMKTAPPENPPLAELGGIPGVKITRGKKNTPVGLPAKPPARPIPPMRNR